jgi:hypothetical protein
MKHFALVALALALGQTPQTQTAAINAAKHSIVQDIDKTLPRATFEAWLRGLVGPQAVMKWEVNDCGEQTGGPADRGRDFPLCVEVQAGLSRDRQLSLSLLVGSFGRGVTAGPLMLYQGNISGPKGAGMITIKKLSDLPKLVAPLQSN